MSGRVVFFAMACFALIFILIGSIIGCAVLGGSEARASCASQDQASLKSSAPPDDGAGPPEKFVPIYQAAAAKYKLGPKGPSTLAAIHNTESGFGDTGFGTTSSAGAIGPMQFMPATWASVGVDGNGDGKKDAYNIEDAVFGAAHYLRLSGAPKHWYDAIFSYNHADWYVREIQNKAKRYGIEATGDVGSDFGADCDPNGGGGTPPSCDKLSGDPRQIINQTVLPIAHTIAFEDITPESVDAANAAHGPTVSGGRSDHQGPPTAAWAADISNGGSPTPEMDKLADKLAGCFGIKWSGSGAVTGNKDGYRVQMIYRSDVGGNHYNHVHLGIAKE